MERGLSLQCVPAYEAFMRKLLAREVDPTPGRSDFDLGYDCTITYPEWPLTCPPSSAQDGASLYDLCFDCNAVRWVAWRDLAACAAVP